ncbi:MAG: TIGR01777 family oxidoreductase [Myxococcota bacterium]
MKIVIPGGSGQVGQVLERYFRARGDEVVIIARSAREPDRKWDGRTLGDWTRHLDDADVVVNLAGRSVNCRYTRDNLSQMLSSRVDSARIVGEAIARCERPPALWLQMSTATIYAHAYGDAHDEDGELGGSEPEIPPYWRFSVDIARYWEQEQALAHTPQTRKVALRTSLVMNPDPGSVFAVLSRMTQLGLGGAIAGGKQYVSWIHDADFVRAVQWIIDHESIVGPVNLAAPNPLPQKEFQQALRRAWRMPVGLPATAWMVRLAAQVIGSDEELLLKSRRVVSKVLPESGFRFDHPEWQDAARDLVARM